MFYIQTLYNGSEYCFVFNTYTSFVSLFIINWDEAQIIFQTKVCIDSQSVVALMVFFSLRLVVLQMNKTMKCFKWQININCFKYWISKTLLLVMHFFHELVVIREQIECSEWQQWINIDKMCTKMLCKLCC